MDRSEQIVHTAFCESYLLQTWFLINALVVLGYKNIHVNLIGYQFDFDGITSTDNPTVQQKKIIEDIFIDKLNLKSDFNVTAKAYSFAHEYITDVEKNGQGRSHSFDLIDVGGEDGGNVGSETDVGKYSGLFVLWGSYDGSKPEGERWNYNVGKFLCFYLSHNLHKNYCFIPVRWNETRSAKVKTLCENLKDFQMSPANRTGFINYFKNFSKLKEVVAWWREEMEGKVSGVEGPVEFKLIRSAPMDFEELVDKTKAGDNPIIYEAQGGFVKKHFNRYVPDVFLYGDGFIKDDGSRGFKLFEF